MSSHIKTLNRLKNEQHNKTLNRLKNEQPY